MASMSGISLASCSVWQPQDSGDGDRRHCPSPSIRGAFQPFDNRQSTEPTISSAAGWKRDWPFSARASIVTAPPHLSRETQQSAGLVRLRRQGVTDYRSKATELKQEKDENAALEARLGTAMEWLKLAKRDAAECPQR